MARKTVLRRICKYLPKSSELATALALDDAAYRGRQQLSVNEAIANTFVPPPLGMDDPDPTGEVDPPAPPPSPEPAAPRTRTARKPSGGSAAAEPPAPTEPPAEAGPAPRTFAQFVDDITRASDSETAALVLDEARGVLDEVQHTELCAVYRKHWA